MTLAIEYCALGLLAGTIGAAGALGLSWGVTRHVFDIPWRPAPGLPGVGAVLTMLLVCTIGVLASADVLQKEAARRRCGRSDAQLHYSPNFRSDRARTDRTRSVSDRKPDW